MGEFSFGKWATISKCKSKHSQNPEHFWRTCRKHLNRTILQFFTLVGEHQKGVRYVKHDPCGVEGLDFQAKKWQIEPLNFLSHLRLVLCGMKLLRIAILTASHVSLGQVNIVVPKVTPLSISTL